MNWWLFGGIVVAVLFFIIGMKIAKWIFWSLAILATLIAMGIYIGV